MERYLEWVLEQDPDRYKKPRSNTYIDRQTLMSVINNIDQPYTISTDDFNEVLDEVCAVLEKFPYFKLEDLEAYERGKG